MSPFINTLWYGHHPLQWILRPFAWCFSVMTQVRRWYLQQFHQQHSSVPIIVVGNLSVGGVGKTPLVIELAKKLQEKGLQVGVVSRGYGAQIKEFPYEIQLQDQAQQVGDEPLLIAQNTKCPVVISPKRMDAVNYLVEKKQCQIIISDDGLQHYRMGRSIEIVVIDGTRGLGNGYCLPAGPLRESEHRLREVDFIVVNEGSWTKAYNMNLKPSNLIQLSTQKEVSIDVFKEQDAAIAAIAAIGNPQRFYSTLTRLGLKFNTYSYPDHYQFTPDDLNYTESLVIMTQKDAVKCSSFPLDNLYYLPVQAELNDAFWEAFWSHKQLQGIF